MNYNDSNIDCFFLQNLLQKTYTPTIRVLNKLGDACLNEVFIYNKNIYHNTGNPNAELQGPYNTGDYYKDITKNCVSSSNIYTSELHEALGNYLRMLRDCEGVNLLSLYNCFSNRYEDDFSLPINVRDNADIAYRTSIDTGASNPLTRLVVIPVKFHKSYQIFCKKPTTARVQLALYNKKDLIPYASSSGERLAFGSAYRTYVRNSYKDVALNIFNPVSVNTAQITADFTLERVLEPCLFLFIEIPKDLAEYLVVLETQSGDSVYDFLKDNTLLKNDARIAKPYSDKLIGYLLQFAIDPSTKIEQNIARVQKALTHIYSEVYPTWATKGLIYDFDDQNKTATVISLGEAGSLNSMCIPAAIYNKYKNIIYTVKRLVSNLFSTYRGEYIVIPSTVTNIPANFFKNSDVRVITLPQSLQHIGENAFLGCNNLESVDFEGDVNDWCRIIFSNNNSNPLSLEQVQQLLINEQPISGTIVLENGVTSVPDFTFKNSYLKDITLSQNLQHIGENAFLNCSKLDYSVADGVNYIGGKQICVGPSNALSITGRISLAPETKFIVHGIDGGGAFNGASNITHIDLPANLVEVASDTFNYTYNLQHVNFQGTLEQWCNVKFSGAYSNPLQYNITWGYPDREPLMIQGEVPSGAITLNDIKTIPDYTFKGSSITSLQLDATLTHIGRAAFQNCTQLTSIIFNGTKQQWQSVGKDSYWDDNTGDYVVHCIDGDLDWVLTYDSSGEGTAYTVRGFRGHPDIVEIPNTYNGLPVVGIKKRAFYNCDSLINITIPSNVTSIGIYAFQGCRNLLNVTLPNTLTSIGSYLFAYCYRLVDIIIPDTITSIGSYAFSNCRGLTHITIPSNVASIGSSAFSNCYRLIEVYNKSSLNIVAGDTAYGRVAENALNVYTEEGGSKLYTNSDGCISYTDANGMYLVNYIGTGNVLTITEGITQVYKYALLENQIITSVIIPNSVSALGDHAFDSCTALTMVTVGSGLKTIGDAALASCSDLTNIYYNGTTAQWGTIKKGTGWDSNTGDYTIHCTDGDIPKA